jgi:iron-sulfur cluster repair protein YtfE (RIC family)
MRRDDRLIELSREHHTALKLARQLQRSAGTKDAGVRAVASLRTLRAEIEHHFLDEEQRLLPMLRDAGQIRIADRLSAEHHQLRTLMDAPETAEAQTRLGQLLEAHVRFEEREMFPYLESLWAAQEPSADAAAANSKE